MQVLERIKDPLMTLLSRDHFETAFAVLCHFHLIAQRAPIIFSQVGLVTVAHPDLLADVKYLSTMLGSLFAALELRLHSDRLLP